jgi:hypothetical protein
LLELGLQFDYHAGGSKVAAKYMTPALPEKWYLAPMKVRPFSNPNPADCLPIQD